MDPQSSFGKTFAAANPFKEQEIKQPTGSSGLCRDFFWTIVFVLCLIGYIIAQAIMFANAPVNSVQKDKPAFPPTASPFVSLNSTLICSLIRDSVVFLQRPSSTSPFMRSAWSISAGTTLGPLVVRSVCISFLLLWF